MYTRIDIPKSIITPMIIGMSSFDVVIPIAFPKMFCGDCTSVFDSDTISNCTLDDASSLMLYFTRTNTVYIPAGIFSGMCISRNVDVVVSTAMLSFSSNMFVPLSFKILYVT